MKHTKILLTIITTTLIAATALACSNTTYMPKIPTNLPTATEQTQTPLSTSTLEQNPKTPYPPQETKVEQQKAEPTSQKTQTSTPARGGTSTAGSQSGGTLDIEDILENGLANVGASPVHIALRATPIPDSTRCQWRGIARTPQQRADTVRMLLGIQPGDTIPNPEYLSLLLKSTVNAIQPDLPTIVESNFESIARGGLSEEFLFLTCFIDYTSTEYLLGTGPDKITIAFDNQGESPSYNLYMKAHTAGDYGDQPLITREDHQAQMLEVAATAEANIAAYAGTNESVIFLVPMGAHNAIAFEAWQSAALWPLQTNSEGTLSITRTELPNSEPDSQISLVDLKSRITTAAATDAFANSRIANVSGLTQFYRDIGAYDDITPNDGSDETFMPAMPPPMPTCAGSTAVGTEPDQGLVDDCNALLAMQDTLAGTVSLNWSRNLAMSSWNGIRLGGSPQRVHYLLLTDEDLDGSIPPLLGNLSELRRIDLDENSLTGQIPPQLGNLKKLTYLYLFDNDLTGEIPPELGSMTALQVLYPEDNDLTGQVPQELGNLTNLTQLVLAENQLSGPLPDSLGQLANLGHLRLRDNQFTDQIPRSLSALNIEYLGLSGNSFTGCLPTGLDTGGNDDLFRPELAALPSCAPTFGETEYTFTLSATEPARTAVGTVTATPYETGDTVAYAITAGNDEQLFTVDARTGAITLAKTKTASDQNSYTLTVEAEDSHQQTATVTVSVSLTE